MNALNLFLRVSATLGFAAVLATSASAADLPVKVISGFVSPESVIHDVDTDEYLVSEFSDSPRKIRSLCRLRARRQIESPIPFKSNRCSRISSLSITGRSSNGASLDASHDLRGLAQLRRNRPRAPPRA